MAFCSHHIKLGIPSNILFTSSACLSSKMCKVYLSGGPPAMDGSTPQWSVDGWSPTMNILPVPKKPWTEVSAGKSHQSLCEQMLAFNSRRAFFFSSVDAGGIHEVGHITVIRLNFLSLFLRCRSGCRFCVRHGYVAFTFHKFDFAPVKKVCPEKLTPAAAV
jgi:hypothetical protein